VAQQCVNATADCQGTTWKNYFQLLDPSSTSQPESLSVLLPSTSQLHRKKGKGHAIEGEPDPESKDDGLVLRVLPAMNDEGAGAMDML
jgi:hypothetical protein